MNTIPEWEITQDQSFKPSIETMKEEIKAMLILFLCVVREQYVFNMSTVGARLVL